MPALRAGMMEIWQETERKQKGEAVEGNLGRLKGGMETAGGVTAHDGKTLEYLHPNSLSLDQDCFTGADTLEYFFS